MMAFSRLVHRFNDVSKDVWIGNGSKVEMCVSDRFYLSARDVRPSSLAESESVSSLDMRAWDGGEVMLVIGGAAGGGDRIQDPSPPL